ncbi:MAG: archease [Deltaproteobacteria bacterium]|nr:archease [Deltaproteobacteria bacterium]
MPLTPYTLIDHTADLGIIIHGNDLVDLFQNAGEAVLDLMFQHKVLKKSTSMNISISGDDLEDLMVQWLGEILYLFEGERLVVTGIEIYPFTGFTLSAKLKTVPFEPESHNILREIKAVTYHQIEVTQRGDQWTARVIFDL